MNKKRKIYVDCLGYDEKLKGNYICRMELAENGMYLDILIDNEDENLVIELAKHGYGLDKLVYDSFSSVRIKVAELGLWHRHFNKRL